MVSFPWHRREPQRRPASGAAREDALRAEWAALDTPHPPPVEAFVLWRDAEIERFHDHIAAGTRGNGCACSPDGIHWRHIDHYRCRYCHTPWDETGEHVVPGDGSSPVCLVHQVAPDAVVPGCRCNRDGSAR